MRRPKGNDVIITQRIRTEQIGTRMQREAKMKKKKRKSKKKQQHPPPYKKLKTKQN